jgi:glycosyltransferase involved in cell wall biosynthesis
LKKPLYLFHIIDSLGIGGAQAMMFELNLAIQKYHTEVGQSVVLLAGGKINKTFVSSYGIEYVTINNNEIHNVVKRKNLDNKVVIIYHRLMMSDTRILTDIPADIPILVINHTFSFSLKTKQFVNCNCVVSVCGNMHKDILKKVRYCQREMIYNGVNGWRYQDIPPVERSEPPGTLVTGRINALNTIKYSEDWLKWCSGVELPTHMVHYYIGGGAAVKQAKRLSAKLNSSEGQTNRINILGAVDKFEEKVQIIKSWDLFLYEVNRHEGLSISVLEALACGVPVICSDHYGNKEIIVDGVNGYVFKNHKHAKKILCSLISDPSKLASLKESTLAHFNENLDAKFMADKYISLSKSLATGHTKRVRTQLKHRDTSIKKSRPRPVRKARVKRRIVVDGKRLRTKSKPK